MRHRIRVLGWTLTLCLGAPRGEVAAQPAIVVEERVHTFGSALSPIAGLGNEILISNPHAGSLDADVYDGTTGAFVRTITGGGGVSVATSGANVLVGPPETAGPTVRLFDGTTGTLLQTFVPGPTAAFFGKAVAFLGANVLVGDPRDNTAALAAGAVFLFDAATGAVLRTFLSPAPATNESFGAAVAALGGNVLVGAPFDVGFPPAPGAVYLFDGSTGALLRTFTPPPQVTVHFGAAVAALGADVLVGASGEADLFDATTGALLLTFPTPGASGEALAVVGGNVLVGAAFGPTTRHKAFLFDGTTAALLRTFTSPGLFEQNVSEAFFGFRVAAAGPNPMVGDPVADVAYLYCGGAAGCAPCETCGPGGTCVATPHPTCRKLKTSGAAQARLRLRNVSSDAADLVAFSGQGWETTVFFSEFGDPVTAHDETLCLWDESGVSATLVFRATAPAGGTCGTAPCWKGIGRTFILPTYFLPVQASFKYKDPERTPDGIQSVVTKAADGSSGTRIRVKANGANLSSRPFGMPALPLGLPLRVQVQTQDGFCWEAEYTQAKVNSAQEFRAVTP